jgi:23S rRNA pseudouridine2605 synthase
VVSVNGQICENLATQVSESDSVKVRNKLVKSQEHFYVLLNKPKGYVCSAADERNRRTVFDLLPKQWPRLFHVGRLDKDSEGLMILTNDGDLALRLTHPRYKIDKEYEVLLDQPFDYDKHAPKMLRGFMIEGGRAKLEGIFRVAPARLKVVLRQGLKRQIRLMFYKMGYEVERLTRTRIGALTTKGVDEGEWRFLTKEELKQLRGEEREK